MDFIQSLHIEGFKKFTNFDVDFNEHMNILVGENEAGKSTILDAIKIVLNQQYRNADKAILKDLFNTDSVKAFQENPHIKNLPQILIEVQLSLDPNKSSNAAYFYGEAYGEKQQQDSKYGIRFECKYDEELGVGIEESILNGKIPYEYYAFKWTTFANRPYKVIKRPLNFLFINTTSTGSNLSFNYYNKTLFSSIYDKATRIKAKNDFHSKLQESFENTKLPLIGKSRKFGIDDKKVVLENIMSVYENSIALENRGSGMESLIKTKIALDKHSALDVILMEEPENHLSFLTLRKMLEEISKQQNTSQIIITTHNNLIASKLNLTNVLWIADGKAQSLSDVDKDTANFFMKADNNAFLQLFLAKKVLLVEGATEFLLLPKFYKQQTGQTLEDNEIAIISCNGISYNRYIDIAKKTNKYIAVITDNDEIQDKIDEAGKFNEVHKHQHIFMDESTDNWTWEVCVYNENKSKKGNKEELDKLINADPSCNYLFHEKDCSKEIGKMLNNKVDIANKMLNSEYKFSIPKYVEVAIEWLKEK